MLPGINNSFNHFIGIQIVDIHESGCVATLDNRKELHNSIAGVIHGGATYALVDVAMGIGAAPEVDGVQQCVTVECHIHYLLPARAPTLRAEATVLRRGKRLIFMEANVTAEDGTLVATARGTYARVRASAAVAERGHER